MRPSSIILLALVPLILCAGCSPSGPTTAEPEVLLVGVVHQLPDSLSCNWKSAYDKVLRYAPDAMAVEHVPTVDTLSLAHFFGEDFKDYRDSVIVSWEGRRLSLEEMNTLRNTPPAGADSTARLMHQWRYAALMLDMANRDQASFQLRNVDVSRLADTSTAFGRAFVKRHERILGYMRTTEFGNLVHPLAAVLGIEHLHPTDERRYNAEQSLAYQAFAQKLDSTRPCCLRAAMGEVQRGRSGGHARVRGARSGEHACVDRPRGQPSNESPGRLGRCGLRGLRAGLGGAQHVHRRSHHYGGRS
ncbi:MAG: hypothetical protein IPG10_11285 [Flavobacteriales bacterium]|nr:hypothetical protein [Flavobacteriales bacterium]